VPFCNSGFPLSQRSRECGAQRRRFRRRPRMGVRQLALRRQSQCEKESPHHSMMLRARGAKIRKMSSLSHRVWKIGLFPISSPCHRIERLDIRRNSKSAIASASRSARNDSSTKWTHLGAAAIFCESGNGMARMIRPKATRPSFECFVPPASRAADADSAVSHSSRGGLLSVPPAPRAHHHS
jgi:hypothetical protein